MELGTIIIRTILMYFILFAVMRLMGKREIGKLSVFDLIISIMLAEIAVFVIEDPQKQLLTGLIPIGLLVGIQLLIAYFTLKNQTLRGWFDGTPGVLIKHGKLMEQEMRKQRYNLDDLILQLRDRNIANVADVDFAILETSGKLSVIKKPEKENPTREDLGIKVRYEGLPIPVIIDGKVQDQHLTDAGKNRFWLKSELESQGIHSWKDVFLCQLDYSGKLIVFRKES